MECTSKDLGSEKKMSPPDTALLDIKKGFEPCNCRKLRFGFHIKLASLSFVSKYLSSMLCTSYVMGCADVQQRQRHILIERTKLYVQVSNKRSSQNDLKTIPEIIPAILYYKTDTQLVKQIRKLIWPCPSKLLADLPTPVKEEFSFFGPK